jgi:S1-C subfamily serine protease
VAYARKVADALRQHGRIKRGYLGVGTQPVALAEAVAAQVGQAGGLMVISVEKGSPAAQGGLMQGDVLVSLGGAAVTGIEELQAALGPNTVGKSLAVKFVRGGQVSSVSIIVGERE